MNVLFMENTLNGEGGPPVLLPAEEGHVHAIAHAQIRLPSSEGRNALVIPRTVKAAILKIVQ